MLIFDDRAEPIILDSIYTPTITDYFWVLDLNMMDYTVVPLLVLEEIVCPTIVVMIKGFKFNLPANWNMLVYAEETQQLDVVEVSALAGRDFTALIHGPNVSMVQAGRVSVIDYIPDYINIAPALSKHQMLCHPVAPGEWVNVSPSDTYNKYLKDCTVGDII